MELLLVFLSDSEGPGRGQDALPGSRGLPV
jgi:hypothetical protein